MGLFVTCAICGRKETLGLLSGGAWNSVETDTGGVLHACPACSEQHRDWEERVLSGTKSS
jgi:hypothetical protein